MQESQVIEKLEEIKKSIQQNIKEIRKDQESKKVISQTAELFKQRSRDIQTLKIIANNQYKQSDSSRINDILAVLVGDFNILESQYREAVIKQQHYFQERSKLERQQLLDSGFTRNSTRHIILTKI